MYLTVDQVMSYGPCYKNEKVEALFAGRETITLHDVAAMNISDEDKIWLFRQENVLSSGTKFKWLEIIVTRAIKTALTVYIEPSYAKWAENWLNGTNRSARAAVANTHAAVAAARAAARAAVAAAVAADVADAADAYAADVAVYAHVTAYAADVAVYAAVTARAARAAAAEYKQQVADLIELLDKED